MIAPGGTFGRRLSTLPLVVVATGFPVRACELMPAREPGGSETPVVASTKREGPRDRVNVGVPTPPKPLKPATFPEAVIVRALDTLQPTFMRCYLRALDDDPSLGPTKVVLHLEVSDLGVVTKSRATTTSTKLGNCVAGVARALAFPAAGEPALLDVPLFFRR